MGHLGVSEVASLQLRLNILIPSRVPIYPHDAGPHWPKEMHQKQKQEHQYTLTYTNMQHTLRTL